MTARIFLHISRLARLRSVFGWLALSAVALCCTAGGRRLDPGISVRFFGQVSTFDTSFATKIPVGDPPRDIFVEKNPSIIERDIASFYPFRAADGSYAVAFQLDRHGQVILETYSASHRGSVLIATVGTRAGSRVVSTLLVDKAIKDGIIYVPSGFTVEEIREMGKSFLITGRDRIGPQNKQKDATDVSPLAPR